MVALKALHEQLRAALDGLDTLTLRPDFDRAELSQLRFRLSRISGERRAVVDRLYVSLGEQASGDHARRLRDLRENGMRARADSSAHVGQWSLSEVAADWKGYCRASAKMRTAMRIQIEAEKAVLYPRVIPTPHKLA